MDITAKLFRGMSEKLTRQYFWVKGFGKLAVISHIGQVIRVGGEYKVLAGHALCGRLKKIRWSAVAPITATKDKSGCKICKRMYLRGEVDKVPVDSFVW